MRGITEAHDVFVFIVLPFEELLDGLLVIELGVVGEGVEHGNVFLLEADAVLIRLEGLFSSSPLSEVLGLVFLAGDGEFAKDVVTSVPCLGIEHVEGVPLVLHADVHQLGVFLVEDALVAIINPKSVGGLKL